MLSLLSCVAVLFNRWDCLSGSGSGPVRSSQAEGGNVEDRSISP